MLTMDRWLPALLHSRLSEVVWLHSEVLFAHWVHVLYCTFSTPTWQPQTNVHGKWRHINRMFQFYFSNYQPGARGALRNGTCVSAKHRLAATELQGAKSGARETVTGTLAGSPEQYCVVRGRSEHLLDGHLDGRGSCLRVGVGVSKGVARRCNHYIHTHLITLDQRSVAVDHWSPCWFEAQRNLGYLHIGQACRHSTSLGILLYIIHTVVSPSHHLFPPNIAVVGTVRVAGCTLWLPQVPQPVSDMLLHLHLSVVLAASVRATQSYSPVYGTKMESIAITCWLVWLRS